MDYRIIPPSHLQGVINLPASKSISNRVLVMQALTPHTDSTADSLLLNLAECDDTCVMRQWLAAHPKTIDIGAAGTAMRFSTALLAVTQGVHLITGTERMRHRPIGILVEALRSLGAEVEYAEKEGFPPLQIHGQTELEGGELTLRGDVSSQFISALLMIGPVLKQGLTLQLQGTIVSRPYIDLTLSLMREFGANADWEDERTIRVQPQSYAPCTFTVENDWSAASYWFEMMALGGASANQQRKEQTTENPDEIVLEGLFSNSLQGDSEVARIFEQLGVRSESIGENRVRLTRYGQITKHLDYDFVRVPDLAQTLVVTCCMMGVPFHFTGLQSLRIKETDRLAALQTELGKLGFNVTIIGDSEMRWDGVPTETPTAEVPIDTYDDHRMAMAFAPCALCGYPILIRHAEVVTKSYPTYWENLRQIEFKTVQP